MEYTHLLNKLEINEPFAYTRWGDGEWLNVNNENGQNCDGNIYYKDLGQELKAIASVPQDYNVSCQTNHDISLRSAKIYPQNWFIGQPLHDAHTNDTLKALVSILRNKHVVYIGNESLRRLEFINEFIEIPYNNCWLIRDDILNKIKMTFTSKLKVYCFSAGMATNVFIDRLWKVDDSNTYLDVGSIFDPCVGRTTRRYHKNWSE